MERVRARAIRGKINGIMMSNSSINSGTSAVEDHTAICSIHCRSIVTPRQETGSWRSTHVGLISVFSRAKATISHIRRTVAKFLRIDKYLHQSDGMVKEAS